MTGVKNISEQSSYNITMPDTPEVSLYWMLVIKVLNGIGGAVTMVFMFEFTMAQTPNRMRGIMMGLVITMGGWATSGSSLFAKIFDLFKVSKIF